MRPDRRGDQELKVAALARQRARRRQRRRIAHAPARKRKRRCGSGQSDTVAMPDARALDQERLAWKNSRSRAADSSARRPETTSH